MSRNDNDDSDAIVTSQPSTAAADVSFAKLNAEHHAESSSQGGSRTSISKRSSSSSDKRIRDQERGKRRTLLETPNASFKDRHSDGSASRRSKRSGGFLLDTIFSNGHANGKEKAVDGRVASDKRQFSQNRKSADSQRSSPLSRELSPYDPNEAQPEPINKAHSPGMDPAQLVQMALNLSESRKRHVSSTVPGPISPAGGRRVASALNSSHGTVRCVSSGAKRNSQSIQRVGQAPPHTGRPSLQDTDRPENGLDGENLLYSFSPATLSRAEKARRYFELASEHRRLLEHLPPLLPDASAPENYTAKVTSSPGSAHYHVTRVPTNTATMRQLGRAYNPLQALRNRRLRNRERRPWTAPPDAWQETDRIKHWIDGVEAASKDPTYRPGEDQVRLPTFSGELEGEAAQPEPAKHHTRSNTASSVITRPENGWTMEPAELLADTYWIEKNDNKAIIEDNRGQRIFPTMVRASLDVPRRSRESGRVQETQVENHSQREELDDEDPEKFRSRRRHLLPIPGRLRRGNVNRSRSASSVSSDEGRLPPAHQFGNDDGGDENIGPLERHMRSMIAKEEKGELPSPELVSPDHWDSRNLPFPNARTSMDTARRDSFANGRLSVDARGPRRSKSADGRVGSFDHGVSSMGEIFSDVPASSTMAVNSAAKNMDASPPPQSKRSAPTQQKPKRSHLPKLRSRSKERNNIEQTDFAAGYGKSLSPVMSADTVTGVPRSSLDYARPSQFKRNDTTDSSASSLRRMNTTASTLDSSRESGALGGRRFFKGGRITELVRYEGSRLGDRFRGSRDKANETTVDYEDTKTPLEPSDAETDQSDFAKHESQGDDDGQISPRASFEGERPKQKYFTSNLPSFKSPSGRDRRFDTETALPEVSDPLNRNARQQRGHGYSGNSALLVPPRINLPDDDSVSNPDLDRENSEDLFYGQRKSASQNDLSLVSTNETISQPRKSDGLFVTGLSGHDAKRHWSISDQTQPRQTNKVTGHDIARVRALLLASGVKAHAIYHEGDKVRDPPLPLLSKAADTAGRNLSGVRRKEENVVAARMLSEVLSTTLTSFEQTLQQFQDQTARHLGSQLEELSHRASEQLTKIVDETSDEADAFNVELTTKQPQEVKRVDEAVDAMFRQRRKQFRLFRRAGFKLLEWLVLGIMWWVWFVVVLFNSAKKLVIGILRVLRWLLWF
ncbi:Hypothetical predicted protein [Lecanosticta acicola]|uniref:Uncharacterized protein n=1 Tax=Lecanosticta acicola TaxID=111012 RepID=A0AAI8Z6K4_9PEZI|nr:Hypothetical predicted protein [Lecanosticta acicola]